MQKIVGFILLLAAYALLYPGLTHPMLDVSGTVEKTKLMDVGKEILNTNKDIPAFIADMANKMIDGISVDGTVSAFEKSNSILGTAKELYNNQHKPVAGLILLFSVGVPLLKALILIVANLPLRNAVKRKLLWVSGITSKWSMADVFVVAIFVSFLAAKGLQESRGLVDFDANIGTGFYYFLGYCLVSILGTQLLTTAATRELDNADAQQSATSA